MKCISSSSCTYMVVGLPGVCHQNGVDLSCFEFFVVNFFNKIMIFMATLTHTYVSDIDRCLGQHWIGSS